jgi:hypothetical protein
VSAKFLTETSRWALLAAFTFACSKPQIIPGKGSGDSGGTSGKNGGRGGSSGGGQGGSEPTDGPSVYLPDLGMPDARVQQIGDGGCNKLSANFSEKIPSVVLLLDRSSSMNALYGTPMPGMPIANRWNTLKQAVLDPINGLIKPNEKIQFGLATYTATSANPTCPWLNEVAIKSANYDAINALLAPEQLPPGKGETPTSETVAAAIAKLDQIKDGGSKYIVLATDGEPDTCPGHCVEPTCPVPDSTGWPRDPQCGQDRSVAAVQDAFKKGIKTFVIGIGDEVGAEHLQALANAGAGQPVAISPQMMEHLTGECRIPAADLKGKYDAAGGNAHYFTPTNLKELSNDFNVVIGAVRSCKFTLAGKVVLANAGQGMVSLDGMDLKYGDPNGWRMNSETELEIVGSACEDLLHKPEASVSIAFPCAVYFE